MPGCESGSETCPNPVHVKLDEQVVWGAVPSVGGKKPLLWNAPEPSMRELADTSEGRPHDTPKRPRT